MDVSDSNKFAKVSKDLDLGTDSLKTDSLKTDSLNNDETGGEALIDQLVEFSRLPEDEVKSELDSILQKAGCESEHLTLDELRAAMLSYLETFHDELEAQNDSEPPVSNGQPIDN